MEIHLAKPALTKLMNLDLPVNVAFRLSRIAKLVGDVFQDIEVQRVKLVEKHGVPSGPGFKVEPENVAVFEDELNLLLDTETVTLDVAPIILNMLGDVKLTPMEMLALEPFLAEE